MGCICLTFESTPNPNRNCVTNKPASRRASTGTAAARSRRWRPRAALCNPVSAPPLGAPRAASRRASMSSVGGRRPSLAERAAPRRSHAPPCLLRSRSHEQLSIKTKERDGRSPLPLAGRPVSRPAPHARQFSFEQCLSRLSAASLRPKFTAAKGFSFVPIFEDLALVLCFRARTAINLGLLRSRSAFSFQYCIGIPEFVQNFVTAILRNAYAG